MDPSADRHGPQPPDAASGRGRFHWPTFAADAALVSGGALAANVLNFVFHFALSRTLGPEGYGSLATLLAFAMIAGVAGSSIGTVAMQETARFWALRQDASIGAFGRAMVRTATGLGAAVGAAIALLSIPLSRYLHIADENAWIALSIALFAGIVAAFARGGIQGAHRFGVYAASLVTESGLKLGVGFLLATAGFGVGGAMGGVAFGAIAGAGIALFSLLRGEKTETVTAPASRFGGAALRLGIIYAASTALLYVDIVLAKHGLTSADAGYYSAAGQMARIIPFGVSLVVPLVTPKAVAARHTSRGELAHLLAVTFGTALCGGVLALAAMELWPQFLIAATFGPKFATAAPLLRWYAVDGLLLACGMLASAYLAAMGEYAIGPWLIGAAVLEAAAMAAWGDSPARLLSIAIAGNALLLAPLVFFVARTLRAAPQAPSPPLAEGTASLHAHRSSDSQ